MIVSGYFDYESNEGERSHIQCWSSQEDAEREFLYFVEECSSQGELEPFAIIFIGEPGDVFDEMPRNSPDFMLTHSKGLKITNLTSIWPPSEKS